jgi:hypothetical protein
MYLGCNASYEEILEHGDIEQIKLAYDKLLDEVAKLRAENESLENAMRWLK